MLVGLKCVGPRFVRQTVLIRGFIVSSAKPEAQLKSKN